MPGAAWTTTEVRTLREQYEAGTPTREIAAMLGRTDKAVRSQADELALRRPALPADLRERMLQRVRVDEESGCWIWAGRLSSKGLPVLDFMQNGKREVRSVRRLLLTLDGKWKRTTHNCRASCEDPLCVAPMHTIQMTGSQYITWRHRCGSTNNPKAIAAITRKRRENSKVTLELVRSMRARAAAGESVTDLMPDWPCSDAALRHVLSGRSWKETAAAASVFTWRPQA